MNLSNLKKEYAQKEFLKEILTSNIENSLSQENLSKIQLEILEREETLASLNIGIKGDLTVCIMSLLANIVNYYSDLKIEEVAFFLATMSIASLGAFLSDNHARKGVVKELKLIKKQNPIKKDNY